MSSTSGRLRKRAREDEGTADQPGAKRNRTELIPVNPVDYVVNAEWVSPSRLRNHLLRDPCIDWLIHHNGTLPGAYSHSVSKAVSEPRSANSFTEFIMQQGREFEDQVMRLLYNNFGKEVIVEVGGELNSTSKEKVAETLGAMNKGVPFIHSGLLHDPQHRTYGVPDLLVRSDWVNRLVSYKHVSSEQETVSAPSLKDVHKPDKSPKYHYVVVDVKFSTLYLRADGIHLLNTGSIPAYKGQVWIYNEALARLQGYKPRKAYLLGRKWRYTSKGETYKGSSCFERLGEVDFEGVDTEVEALVLKAIEWIRDVRSPEARNWDVLTVPLPREELYPNMCNNHDHPWRGVKEQIAAEIKELTTLWMVGTKHREHSHSQGIYQWTDPRCTIDTLGFKGDHTRRILSKVLDVNQNPRDLKVRPKVIENDMQRWQSENRAIEFYVDFETINDVLTDFGQLPEAEPSSMIFMIGVGSINPETKEWRYQHFTVDSLTSAEESRICTEFSRYIMSEAEWFECKNPLLVHWANAESWWWDEAVDKHKRVAERMKWIGCGDEGPEWFDLLKLFQAEPIVIQGCFSFNLKQVAKSLHHHGFIKTIWDEGSSCLDGRGAMVGAWKAHREAKRRGIRMRQMPEMNEISRYNEVDVRTLQEIVAYLRKEHTVAQGAQETQEECSI